MADKTQVHKVELVVKLDDTDVVKYPLNNSISDNSLFYLR